MEPAIIGLIGAIVVAVLGYVLTLREEWRAIDGAFERLSLDLQGSEQALQAASGEYLSQEQLDELTSELTENELNADLEKAAREAPDAPLARLDGPQADRVGLPSWSDPDARAKLSEHLGRSFQPRLYSLATDLDLAKHRIAENPVDAARTDAPEEYTEAHAASLARRSRNIRICAPKRREAEAR